MTNTSNPAIRLARTTRIAPYPKLRRIRLRHKMTRVPPVSSGKVKASKVSKANANKVTPKISRPKRLKCEENPTPCWPAWSYSCSLVGCLTWLFVTLPFLLVIGLVLYPISRRACRVIHLSIHQLFLASPGELPFKLPLSSFNQGFAIFYLIIQQTPDLKIPSPGELYIPSLDYGSDTCFWYGSARMIRFQSGSSVVFSGSDLEAT